MTGINLKVKPCVGCGFCCKKAPCHLAVAYYGRSWQSPCPALVSRGGRYWCRFIDEAKGQHRIDLMKDLAINAGCCASMFNTDREQTIRRLREQRDNNNGSSTERADGAGSGTGPVSGEPDRRDDES